MGRVKSPMKGGKVDVIGSYGSKLLETLENIEEAPMKVIPFSHFKTHGRIPRSDDKLTVNYEPSMQVVFISHRWWNPSGSPPGPDYAEKQKNRKSKHEIIVKGIEKGLKNGKLGLDAKKDVHVWIDFACIEQDDVEKKLNGIRSLVSYIARSDVLVIPMNEMINPNIHLTPNYGKRAWCRLESFMFSIVERVKTPFLPAKCFFIGKNYALTQATYTYEERYKPSSGDLTAEADRQILQEIEGQALTFAGHAIVEYALSDLKINENRRIKMVKQLLENEHLESLCKELDSYLGSGDVKGNKIWLNLSKNELTGEGMKHLTTLNLASAFRIEELNLSGNLLEETGISEIANQLKHPDCSLRRIVLDKIVSDKIAPESLRQIRDALKVNKSLRHIVLTNNNIDGDGAGILCEALSTNTTLETLDISKNQVCYDGAKRVVQALEAGATLEPLSFKTLFMDFHNMNKGSIEHIKAFNERHQECKIVSKIIAPERGQWAYTASGI